MIKFIIKNYPDDVYCAVGKIIKAAQEFEQDFKNLTKRLDLSVKNISNSSLNKLNDALKTNGIVGEDCYEKMKKVIYARNYINHTFFIEDFNDTSLPYDEKIKKLEDKLLSALFMIFEANDVINNIFDKLNGINITRPTIFD